MALTRRQLPETPEVSPLAVQSPFDLMGGGLFGQNPLSQGVFGQGLGGSNSAAQEQLAAAVPRRETPEQAFNRQYLEQKNAPLSPDRQNMPRWRQLTADEIAAQGPVDPKTAPQPGQRGYTTSINGSTYRYDTVAEDPQHPTRNADLMGGNASQFFSRAFVTERAKKNPKDRTFNDVSILGADGRVVTQQEDASGRVELPDGGFGYSTYNRNDITLPNGHAQKDQWGTPSTIANLINTAADYRTMRPNHTIEYGDIGTDDGLSPLTDQGKTTRHATHGGGTQVDLRYAGSDFENNTIIRNAENWGANNFYYSPAMQGDLHFGTGVRATPENHHRDHLHMGWGR